ncbi:MAG: hypothetical protein J5970_01760 [Bacilli bacterium]|nr:hypothetical protein [Bacilli bacterium]
MKKIIPFSKEIEFNTNIYEINSISLEHNLKIKDNKVTGEFIISGDYKEDEFRLNVEPFIYNIPFNIDLDDKYILDEVKIEIDDFNYEVKNNKLEINISVSIDNIEVIELLDEPIVEYNDNREEVEQIEDVEVIDNKCTLNTIFDSFEDKDDVYVTYNVHIYRENDTIDNIINLYKTTKEKLEEYNDLSNITLGSKIIIPSNEQL